jgi:hypothetical protein
MPIRPENKDRYPDNWQTIRRSILERSLSRCERCGVENYAEGWRDPNGLFVECLDESVGLDYHLQKDAFAGKKPFRVVLTIAHLDHCPENNDPDNLKALCQRCHNRHDIAERVGVEKNGCGNKSARSKCSRKSETG